MSTGSSSFRSSSSALRHSCRRLRRRLCLRSAGHGGRRGGSERGGLRNFWGYLYRNLSMVCAPLSRCATFCRLPGLRMLRVALLWARQVSGAWAGEGKSEQSVGQRRASLDDGLNARGLALGGPGPTLGPVTRSPPSPTPLSGGDEQVVYIPRPRIYGSKPAYMHIGGHP